MIDNKGRNITHNYIIAEFNIKKDNQNIRIINSYEQSNTKKNLNIKKRMKMKKK